MGLQIIITVGAIAAACWIIVTSVEEQSSTPVPGGAQRESYMSPLAKSSVLAIAVIVLCYFLLSFLSSIAFGEYIVSPPLFPLIPAVRDNFSNYIGQFLVPGVDNLIGFSNILLTAGGIILVVAVSSTLLQHPTDKQARTNPANDPQNEYPDFLTRCFERLTVAVYIGAITLVVCVAQLNARYAWPASLIPVADDTDPLGQLSKMIGELSGQLGLEYGLAFTVVLVAMYLPTLESCCDRSRRWCRMRRIPGPTLLIKFP
jgi:hypothetical protein